MMFWLLASFAWIPSDYPRGDLLIEPVELSRQLEKFRILDARPSAAYQAGHVPGAVMVAATEWAKQFQNGQDVSGWSDRIGKLGIGSETKVVIYDDAASKDAARVWWILKYWGVKDVRLLNGQWTGWKGAGLPMTQESQSPQRVTFQALPVKDRLATKEEVLQELAGNSSQIVDARTEAEYSGKTKLARRAGCIPGSVNLDWAELVDARTQRFKPAAELKTLFAQHGLHLDKPLTAHCQSGGRSSVMSFALELMGAKAVRNYHASWSEWGNAADTPVSGPGK